ncbi:MAG: TSUP family transporter [Parachlamydiaceae bacterium]|nr:MAG: TSUP family transporter [Parachlamydiaceae bacterium]
MCGHLFEFSIYLIIGCAAGVLSGLLGVGGGLVVVPSLLVIFNYLNFPPESLMQTAVGTSLASMIFTVGSSAWAHRKGVNWLLFKN